MAKKKVAAPKKRSRKQKADGEGDTEVHARQLAPERAVKAFINERISVKNSTSEAGQQMSTATKRFADAGGNVPAAVLATRYVSKAKQDPIKARVLLEDTLYYLECMDFDRLAPKGMFTAEESGQKRSRKPKQAEMELADHSRDFEGSDGGPLPEQSDESVVTH